MSLDAWVAVIQGVSSSATLILAVAVWFQIKANREQADATRATVEEMRESRLAQERPHVIVDTDYGMGSMGSLVFVVVRNIGRGAAKDITFEFSRSMESPETVAPNSPLIPVNKQPYLDRGLDYLAPGAEISCLWGSMKTLTPFLRERGVHEGITITSRYKSLIGEPLKTEWTVNPLLVSGTPYVEQKGVHEIARATENISKDLFDIAEVLWNAPRGSTYPKQRRREPPEPPLERVPRGETWEAAELRSWWRRFFGFE